MRVEGKMITEYGFTYGSAEITRMHTDTKTGAVYLGIKTPKADMQIYITKTGKVRIFNGSKELK